MISKKIMTNLDVLSLRVLNWVVSNLDGTLIVAEERHILHVDAIVLEGFASSKAVEHSMSQQQCIQLQQ